MKRFKDDLEWPAERTPRYKAIASALQSYVVKYNSDGWSESKWGVRDMEEATWMADTLNEAQQRRPSPTKDFPYDTAVWRDGFNKVNPTVGWIEFSGIINKGSEAPITFVLSGSNLAERVESAKKLIAAYNTLADQITENDDHDDD